MLSYQKYFFESTDLFTKIATSYLYREINTNLKIREHILLISIAMCIGKFEYNGSEPSGAIENIYFNFLIFKIFLDQSLKKTEK